MSIQRCLGVNCLNTKLVDAHIFPRGFARDVMGKSKHNLLISPHETRVTHHGIYDKEITCAGCDNVIGEFDDYALRVFREFQDNHQNHGKYFVMPGVDGDKFAVFVLAVLWRASVSSRKELKVVDLGKYEESAKEIIFKLKPLSDLPDYQLTVGRYVSKDLNVESFYSLPAHIEADGGGWGFSLHGFRVMAKLNPTPLPEEMRPVIVNGNNRLIGLYFNYEGTTEHSSMLKIAEAHMSRTTSFE